VCRAWCTWHVENDERPKSNHENRSTIFKYISLICARDNQLLHGKNDFAKVSKNLAKYISENNFVWTIKIIM